MKIEFQLRVSWDQFDFLEIMRGSSSSKLSGSAKVAERGNQKQVYLNGMEDSVDSFSYCPDLLFFQGEDTIAEPDWLQSNHEEQQVQANVGALDYLYLDMVSPPIQACRDNMRILSSINAQLIIPSVSSDALRFCRSRAGTDNRNEIDGLNDETKRQSECSSTLSTNQKIELAAENFIHFFSGTREKNHSAVSHAHANTISGLLIDDAKDIQLVQDLLSCAEKVCSQQYDCASKLLEGCSKLSLSQMNVIQRLVYYFTEALCEKIGRETGRLNGKGEMYSLSHDSIAKIYDMAAIFQKLPLSQIIQFPGIQTVASHVSKSRKVNIIDLNLCCGVQQMILLQTLAARSDCPLQHVKITVLAISPDPMTEEVGAQLRSLADSLNLNFSFHVISLDYVLDHQQNPLDLDPEETVVVHAAFALWHMIGDQNRLETLMRVIRNMNPSLMIISEAEANVNSPVFVNRFVEALFFYGAYFDYVEACLDNDDERTSLESGLLIPAIRNVVAAEGEERKYRVVGIDVWRAFLARFGMVETELGILASSHANSVLEKFDCRDSCSLCMNGKCLIVSWKETPMYSLSAWKFQEM